MTTGEDGRFALRSGEGFANSDGLRVLAAGYARARVLHPDFSNLADGDELEHDTELLPEARVSGTVTGPDGPVPGAEVRVWIHADGPFYRDFDYYAAVLARTGIDGTFFVGGLAPGTAAVQVVSEELVQRDWAGSHVHPGWLVCATTSRPPSSGSWPRAPRTWWTLRSGCLRTPGLP